MESDQWPYKATHTRTGNRFGKSVIFSVVGIWFAVYKHRVPVPYGTEEWFDFPFSAVNIGPVNENAYVVREKVGLILQDKAKEQILRIGGRGHILPEIQALFKTAKNKQEMDRSGNPFLLTVPDTEYKGYITEHNAHLEFRTTDDHFKAGQGRTKYLVSFDEAGRYKDCVTLIGSDIIPRTIDSRGIVMTATTPHLETDSDYEEVWNMGDPENPDRSQYQMSFTGSMRENPHVTEQMIEEALDGQPDYLRDQIIEGKFVQSHGAFFNADTIRRAAQDIPNQRRRTRGHQYVISWDLAIAKDGDLSIGVVWDVSKAPIEMVEYKELRRGSSSETLVNEMREMLEFYNNERFNCRGLMTFDETGFGGLIIREQLQGLRPRPRPFQFAGGKHKKISILMSLKVFLDRGWLVFPKSCNRLQHELKRYRIDDNKLDTDSVMAMSMGAALAEKLSRPYLKKEPLARSSFVY